MAVIALKNHDAILRNLEILKEERQKVMRVLETFPSLTLYPSGSNFIYFETDRAEAIYQALLKQNILIKRFAETDATPGSIRFSMGKPQENQKILDIIKEVVYNEA